MRAAGLRLRTQYADADVAAGGIAAVLVSVMAGIGVATSPFLTVGVATGAVLMVFALMQPLALVGLMLAIGPIDLSFITGGFKSMFEQLGGLDMNGIRLIGMTAALTLVVITDRKAGRQLFRPAALFYGLLIAYAAFTLTFSPSPVDGARLLLKLAYPLLVFLVIAGLSPERASLDRLMDVVLVGAAIICLVINPLYVGFGDFDREIAGWTRLRGAGTHQNPFAFYLLAALLMSFVRFTTRRQWRYVLLCVVCGAWMVLTITRIAFLASLVALAAVGIVSAIVTRNYRALAAAAAVLILLSIPFAPPVIERTFGFMPSAGEFLGLLKSPRALYLAINWEGRQVYWPVVMAAVLTSPILGLGLGSSAFVLRVHFPSYWSNVVHNDYLRLLSDTGLLGVTLFGAAMITWTAIAVRALKHGDRTVREYALPAIGCIAGLSIIGITDNAFDYYGSYTQYVGFLSGGVAAGVAAIHRQAAAATEPPEPAAPATRLPVGRWRR